MSKRVVVAGIPGVGKTTVLKELQKLLGESGASVEIVNFGTVMKGLFEGAGQSMQRDEMRGRAVDLQREVQGKAAAIIAERGGHATVLVDTHMFVETKDGFLAGTPSHVLAGLKPSLFILLEANPEEISKRRLVDKDRLRGPGGHGKVMEELSWSRATAAACGVLTGAPVKIITNESGRQREAAEAILRLLSSRDWCN